MARLTSAIVVILLSAFVAFFALSFLGSGSATSVCDGVFPKWVLDAQGYEGGGCATLIPLDQAPKNADWTPVCTGMCLCGQGELYIDGACTAVPRDEPWPSSVPYDSW